MRNENKKIIERPGESGTSSRSRIDRRNFLAGAAGVAAGLAVGSSRTLAQAGATTDAAIADSANPFKISLMMWTYKPRVALEERVTQTKALGIDAIELVRRVKNRRNDELAAILRDNDIRVHNVDAGTSLFGKKYTLTNPGERANVLANLKLAVKNARLFGADTLLALSGNEVTGMARDQMHASVVDGLKAMMEIVEGEGLDMILEPLNRFDHPGHYLRSMDEAFDIVGEVGSHRLKILFDIYHVQREEGNLIDRIEKNIHLIGHFHVADTPGRHEPGTGEINYANVLHAIGETGYRGYVGLEFIPTGDHDALIAEARTEVAGYLAAGIA